MLLVPVSALAALALGVLVAQFGDSIDFKVVIALPIGIALAAVLLGGERLWKTGLYLWVLSFAIGYRTLDVTSGWRLHPSEILLWALCAVVLISNLLERRRFGSTMPRIVWIFPFLWGLGVLRALFAGVGLDRIMAELLPMADAIAVFYLVGALVETEADYRRIGMYIILVCLYVSLLGAAEYYLPWAVSPFHGFFGQAVLGTTQEGFTRVWFSFWGSPVVAQVMVLCLPLMLAQFYWWRSRFARAFLFGVIALTVFACFLSGYRTVWLLTPFLVAIYFMLRQHRIIFFLALLLVLAILFVVPQTAELRAENLFERGFFADSSSLKRFDRIQLAWELFLQSPYLGNGWTASGWVHSDILQIAANLGIGAALAYLVWYGLTLFKVWTAYRAPGQMWIFEQSAAALTFLIGFGVIFATQAVIVLPQVILPMWFLFALANRLADLNPRPSAVEVRRANFHLASDL